MYRVVIYGTSFAVAVWLVALAAIVLVRAAYLKGHKSGVGGRTYREQSRDDDTLVADRHGGNREAFYGMCVVSIVLGTTAAIVLACLYALDTDRTA